MTDCNAKHDRVNKVISMPRSFDEHAPECLFQIDFPSHAPSKTTSITFDSVPALGKDCENFWEFEECKNFIFTFLGIFLKNNKLFLNQLFYMF